MGGDVGEGFGSDEMAHVLLQGEIDGGGTFATFGREGRAREDALAVESEFLEAERGFVGGIVVVGGGLR